MWNIYSMCMINYNLSGLCSTVGKMWNIAPLDINKHLFIYAFFTSIIICVYVVCICCMYTHIENQSIQQRIFYPLVFLVKYGNISN